MFPLLEVNYTLDPTTHFIEGPSENAHRISNS